MVLPAPFGPIRAWTSLVAQVEIDVLHGLEPAEMAGEAARLEDHGSHGRSRARSAPRRPRGAKRTSARSATPTTIRCASVTALERSIEVEHQERAEERAEHGAGAAEQDVEQRQDRILDRGEGGADIAEEEAVGGPGRAAIEAGEDERAEPVPPRVVAEHPGALLVLADGDEDAAGGRAGEAEVDEQGDGEERQRREIAGRVVAEVERADGAGGAVDDEALVAARPRCRNRGSRDSRPGRTSA